MRFAPFAWFAVAAATVIFVSPSPTLAQDRYGGDLKSPASSFDFSGAFDKLPPSTKSDVGGYRSSSGITTSAPRPSSGNELRSRTPPSTPPAPSSSSSQLRSLSTPAASPRASAPAAPRSTAAATTPTASSPARAPQSFNTKSTAQAGGSATRSSSSLRSSSTLSAAPSTSGRGYSQPSSSTQRSVPSRTGSRDYTRPTTSSSSVASQSDYDSLRSGRPSRSSLSSRLDADTASPQAGVRERKTRELLEKMLRPRSESRLNGTPMSLASVVSSAGSRTDQAQRVDAYWALTTAAADYYLGLAEVGELARLKQRVSTYSQPLSEAQANLATRVDTSLKAARAAQYRLSRLMGGGVMPLPADTPFTGPYATRFDMVFAGGAPEEARLIHDLLPLRLAELQDAADAVARSQSWIEVVAGEPSSRSDGTGIIRALELLALNRRAFVMIARDYNLQINRYAQLASPERVDTGRLVAMLIRTPSAGLGSAEDALMAGFSAGSTSSANREFRSGSPARR